MTLYPSRHNNPTYSDCYPSDSHFFSSFHNTNDLSSSQPPYIVDQDLRPEAVLERLQLYQQELASEFDDAMPQANGKAPAHGKNSWHHGSSSQNFHTPPIAITAMGYSTPVANALPATPTHSRMPSQSSLRSASSASPLPPSHAKARAGRRIAGPHASSTKLAKTLGIRPSTPLSANHLPTPGSTPTRDSYLSGAPNTPHSQDTSLGGAIGRREQKELNGFMQSAGEQADIHYNAATPQVHSGGDESRNFVNARDSKLPTLERTESDARADQLYYNIDDPSISYNQNLSPQPVKNNHLVDRLFAAQQSRSQGSEQPPPSPLRDIYHPSPNTGSDAQTLSPQEVLLDFQVENGSQRQSSLFPDDISDLNYASSNQTMDQIPTTMDFSGVNDGSVAAWNNQAALNADFGTTNGFHDYPFTFQAPYNANLNGLPIQHQSSYRSSAMEPPRITRTAAPQTNDAPEFPAQLTSMESSASSATGNLDATPAPINPPTPSSARFSATPSSRPDDSPRPSHPTADSGTFSCTFSGCPERFSTAQKLQRHKRDFHKSTSHVTPGVGSGMTTEQLMERNSQSGPHKCERINPTTGKPCNTIFSRPYDLTRHEDTIHNIRKQKAKCALCTKEKTFSRSDALTRHMRVVHPEVDFPGKHRKRGPSAGS